MASNETKKFIMDGYLYVHRAMQADIANLEATSTRLTRMSKEDAAKLSKWFEFFWDMVEVHHVEEDNNFFPDITRRDPAFAPQMHMLSADHQHLHSMVDLVAKLLNRIQNSTDAEEREITGRQLTQLLKNFKESLNDHLAREENVVIASIADHFSLKEQKEMEQKTMKSMPRKHMALLVPWVASSMSAEEAAVAIKVIPLPLRIMYNLSWKKKYEKFTSVFRG
jgi:hemerythrin-like domain-containing protein